MKGELCNMLFNSYIFILLFFPLCMVGYFTLNHFKRYTLAQTFLLGMSLWFYGFFNPSYLLIIVISIIGNYFITWIMKKTNNVNLKKVELIVALLLNIGVLFYFKYFDFFIENINSIFNTEFALNNILLPLGISFFTFQQISYVIDFYKGEVKQYDFLQYASFVVYFPQLIAGPIVTHDELIPQFMDINKKKFNWENFSRGMLMFVLGLAKKVLIADTFGNAANWGFDNVADLNTTNAILTVLSYTIQIYFDFSGYCDMAIGIGKMMNIELPINFDSPYKALTITEFWERWHKTLTRFFTKYIYIPLGGSRKGKIRTYINIMIVFLVSGLWHGANWTFVLWGLMHGVFMVITRHFKKQFEKLHPALNWIITFGFLNITWIFFRANSISEGIKMIGRIVTMKFGSISSNITNAFNLTELKFIINKLLPGKLISTYPNLLLTCAFAGAIILILGARNAHEHMDAFKPRLINLFAIVILFVWCVMSFSGVSTFLYFNF